MYFHGDSSNHHICVHVCVHVSNHDVLWLEIEVYLRVCVHVSNHDVLWLEIGVYLRVCVHVSDHDVLSMSTDMLCHHGYISYDMHLNNIPYLFTLNIDQSQDVIR